MFQKLKYAYERINLQKFQRDLNVSASRTRYRIDHFAKDLKKQWDSQGFRKAWNQWEGLKIDSKAFGRQNVKRKMGEIDTKWSSFRDLVSDKVNFGIRKVAEVARKTVTPDRVKQAVSAVSGTGKTFLFESRDFLTSNYRMSKTHLRDYLRANEKLFKHYKEKIFGFSQRTRRRMAVFVLTGVFLYALGSHLPAAVVKYRLEQEKLSQSRSLNS